MGYLHYLICQSHQKQNQFHLNLSKSRREVLFPSYMKRFVPIDAQNIPVSCYIDTLLSTRHKFSSVLSRVEHDPKYQNRKGEG